MRNKLFAAAVLGMALGTVSPAQAAPIATWYGQFSYTERVATRTPDGRPDYVTYTLSLAPPTRGTGCSVTIDGAGIHDRLQCTAMPELESLVIKFYRFEPGASREGFVLGQRLFTLTRGEDGLVTRLQALTPVDPASPRIGRMFRRSY